MSTAIVAVAVIMYHKAKVEFTLLHMLEKWPLGYLQVNAQTSDILDVMKVGQSDSSCSSFSVQSWNGPGQSLKVMSIAVRATVCQWHIYCMTRV